MSGDKISLLLSAALVRHRVKVKFVAVGAWNTVAGYLFFVLFDAISSGIFATRYAGYMAAMVLANIVSVINAYIFHRYVTFRSLKKGREMIGEFVKFCTTYVAVFLLNLLLLPFFVEVGHLTPRIAAALVIPLCTVISYVGHSRFSFRAKRNDG
jgi:putative flippase GtrA